MYTSEIKISQINEGKIQIRMKNAHARLVKKM